jgi:hypothetical protein
MAWFELAGQHLEEGALAGAVRPDQAAQLALGKGEVDVADRLDAAEMHAEIAGLEQRRGHHPYSACCGSKPRLLRRRRKHSRD